jgi:hypothetical protein
MKIDRNLAERINQGRRSFLMKAGAGLGALSAAQIMGLPMAHAQEAHSGGGGILRGGHFPARAKRVIYLHMLGAFSQCDTYDYKPLLEKMHGQDLPASVRGNTRLSTMVQGQTSFPIVRPVGKFAQYGQTGTWVSDLLPYTAKLVDDFCFIKTMNTEHVNHDPASKFLHTGFQLAGRPSEGAWVSYALGSDNDSLPTFVVMSSGYAGGVPNDASAWGSGFLPSHFQGVEFRSGKDPVPYVSSPDGVTLNDHEMEVGAIAKLAKSQYGISHDPDILSRVSQYEMAFRMQSSIPDVADIGKEPQHILDLYGPDVQKPGTFARNCLLARRLAERDVKFITLFDMGWDAHGQIVTRLPGNCKGVDQGTAALLTDLKQRGMLKDTLVVFATEFGRTSFAQGTLTSGYGRDHHGNNFVMWMAGGGVKAGYTHGETDDFCYNIVKDGVHIHDFQATLMYLLGIDHERLTFRYSGRDFRLTDVAGKVVKELVA